MMHDYQHYRSFVCYRRRKEEHPAFASSENVAGALAWWINQDACFRSSAPILCEECYPPTGEYTFDEVGIQKFMPRMRRVFLAICPGFFEEIVLAYQQTCDFVGSTDGAIPLTHRKLNYANNIVYKEISHALENDCEIIPILIDGGETNLDVIAIVCDLFGEKFRNVMNSMNRLSLNYTEAMQSAFAHFSWSTATEEQVIDLMEVIEHLEDICAFKNDLADYYHRKAEVVPLEKALVNQNLRACAQTIINSRRPPYRREERAACTDSFCAGNPLVVYDPVRAPHDPQGGPPYLALSMVEAFGKLKNSCALPNDRFVYWDVNCNPKETGNGISVCAVCFGTMIIHHHLHQDLGSTVNKSNLKWFEDTVQTGINTLVAIRDPFEKTWPSSWIFDGQHMGVEGTINQTTISLSALLACGFLEPRDLPDEALKNRVNFLWESTQCLLDNEKQEFHADGRVLAFWGYTYAENETGALLPTLFVFDTFLKLKQKLRQLFQHFQGRDAAFAGLLAERCEILRGELLEILYYIQSMQRKVGEHIGAFCRMGEREISRTHTAYVIKSLYGYLQQTESPESFVKEMLTEAEAYLLNCIQKAREEDYLQFEEFERYENFCAPDSTGKDNPLYSSNFGDKYEHCAELLIAEALIKIAGNPSNPKEIQQKAAALVDWLLHTYSDSCVTTNEGHPLLVKGNNPNLDYPIFYLYYYRMVMWDYLQLQKKREEMGL